MHHPVFISYARRSSREQALRLQRALEAEGGAFLDDPVIEHGESFPKAIADALLGARVVVVFLDEGYLSSDFCMRELEAVLAPFMVARARGAQEAERVRMLEPLVIALPSMGPSAPELDRLPPAVRTILWPRATDVDALVEQVRERLRGAAPAIGERLAACSVLELVWANLLRTSAPRRLANLRRAYLPNLGQSLGQAFLGREDELWQLHYRLASRSASLVVLEGAMGTGKTQLAVEYLYRFGMQHFRGGIFWVDAEADEARREEQLHGILRALEPDTQALGLLREMGIDLSLELARALQAVPANEPILYVVDNVPEAEPAAPELLRRWCPSPGSVSLLATSRGSPSLAASGASALKLEVLEPGAAVSLLTWGLADASPGDTEWLRVAGWVGCLPLALSLLNRALAVGGVHRRELLERMGRSGPVEELERQRAGLRSVVSLSGVEDALAVSYEQLPEAAQRTARLLAQLAPDPIPLELVNALVQDAGSPEVRSVLVARHFITPVQKGAVAMFGRMHRVLADFLRRRDLGPPRSLDHVVRVLAHLMSPPRCADPKEWPAMNVLRGHAEWCFQRLKAERLPVEPVHVRMMLSVGLLLSEQGHLTEARELHEELLTWSAKELGPRHPETATVMHNLGQVLVATREDLPRARQLLQGTLEICVEVHGEVSPRAYDATVSLAGAYLEEGRYEEAFDLHVRALELYPRNPEAGWPSPLPRLVQYAELRRRSGALEEARELLEEFLPGSRERLGDDHPAVLAMTNNLALTYSVLGRHVDARALLEDCVARSRRKFGPAHRATLQHIDNLLRVLMDLGDLDALRRVLLEIREAIRSSPGEALFRLLPFANNLAARLSSLEEHALAHELYWENLVATRKQWPVEHPLVTLSAMGMFSTLLDMRRFDEAEEIRSRFLAWLATREPDSLHPIQRGAREDVKFVMALVPSPQQRRRARCIHLVALVWALLGGSLLAFFSNEGGLAVGTSLVGVATAMGLSTFLLTRKVQPVSLPALLTSLAWLCVLGVVTRLGGSFWALFFPVGLDVVVLARLSWAFRRFEKHEASLALKRQNQERQGDRT